MWTRKHLKHQAKKSLKSNYQKMVSVCFLIAFLTTSFASSTFIFRQFRPGLQTIFVQTHLNFPDASNSSIAADTLHHVFQISLSGTPLASLFEHMLNIYTSGRSFIFATLKTVNEAFLDPFSTSFFCFSWGYCSLFSTLSSFKTCCLSEKPVSFWRHALISRQRSVSFSFFTK